MVRFFKEWWKFARFSSVWGGATSMTKALAGSAAVLPPAIASVLFAVQPLPWMAVVGIMLVVWWLALTAGMAWVSAKEPSVVVGPVTLDEGDKMFHMRLHNGPAVTTPAVLIVSVSEPDGLQHLTGSAVIRPRGKVAGGSEEMQPGEEADYALLYVRESQNKHQALAIFAEGGWTPITRDLPIREQKEVTVRFFVNCVAGEERGKSQEFSFTVAPDPNSTVGYKLVTPSGPAAGGWSYPKTGTLRKK